MISQKEAVYTITMNILKDRNILFECDEKITTYVTKDMRKTITMCLINAMKCKEVTLDKSFKDKELRAYAQSVVSNWFRKDIRLNGGIQYSAKKTGSRIGLSDPQIKAMKSLLKEVKKTNKKDYINKIELEIKKRLSEIRKDRLGSKIDANQLPDHLRKLVK